MANDFPTYTDMKRTRVIERDSVYTRPRENASIGSTQPIAKKEGLFDGISIGQIAASAAAAATSMLLASKIGIAGSRRSTPFITRRVSTARPSPRR